MDGKVAVEKEINPREGANILNVLTYVWVAKLFRLGYKRDLELKDLYRPLKEHKSNVIGDKLAAAWREEQKRCSKEQNDGKKTPSLLRALISVFGARIALYALPLLFMEIVLRSLQPFAFGRFLRYFADEGVSKSEAYLYAGGMVLISLLYLILSNSYAMAIWHMGMKLRLACCSLVYRKALKLTKVGMDDTTIGEAVNLVSNDVGRFDMYFIGLHYLWVGPLQTVVTTYLMYREVGVAAIYGVIVFLMFIPLQLWFGNITSKLRLRTAIQTDERVCATNEVIKSIQAIKMYAWEYLFRDIIKKIRNSEMSVIKYATYIRSGNLSFSMFVTRLSLFVTVLIYVMSGDTVSSEKVFMLTAFFANLQYSMTIYFPFEVTFLAELNVSVKRIQKFLMYRETECKKEESAYVQKVDIKDELGLDIDRNKHEFKSSVIFNNVHAKWFEDTLTGINMNIESEELVAIIGKVGAGKSSLLHVILKELPITKGTIIVPDKISYASQEPWLFSASVRQNILFGRPMDHQKYHRVIKVCQLERDFTLLPYGDKTIVGERGVSLSGGQRARINLARAVYSDAQLYLLDDPLSAVDAHVGKLLFQQCIQRYLAGRTRILITHQIQFLCDVDKIIVLDEGRVTATGTYEQIMNMGLDIGLLEHQPTHEFESEALKYRHSNSCVSAISLNSISSINESMYRTPNEPEEIEETRTRGSVKKYIYLWYLKAGGSWSVIGMIILLHIISQISASGVDWFLSFWTKLEENNQIVSNGYMVNSTDTESTVSVAFLSRTTCISIFSILILLTVLLSIIKSIVFFDLCVRASKRLHDAMFYCVTRATMYFLNTNTSGRILNRFTKDLGTIDELLPNTLIDCVQIGIDAMGVVVVVAITNPWLLIPSIIVSIVLYVFRIIYVATSRSVKRLEGVCRSPIYNHFSATLQGLTTIRSFEANAILTEEFDRHQDLHSSAWYLYIALSRAFAFWLDCINLIYTVIVTISFLLLSRDSEFTHAANVGLAITQCFALIGFLQWGIRQSAELENQITSVERIKEYTNIESEPPLKSLPDKEPPKDWPQNAKIEFKNVYLSYSPEGAAVLRNLNFVIKPRERVGIVGRTGAGKSSLISALFRLADVKGVITIDGIDTGSIGLHDLRSKISIIPQEPFLFSGSLRKNLDPFDEYEDDVLWGALEDVQLKKMGLDFFINDSGSNLSVGQRQLVCLARAIVKRNKILVLDEATANVDSRTDEFIQMTIRQKFSDCTSITIAHRLNTVMDSDRILVIDAGSVVEFDQPYVLLQNEFGFLSNMVNKAGNTMAKKLVSVAKENYEKRRLRLSTL